MPNSYFQFKEFIIHQDRCAMKVCTDSCIAGAWFANRMQHAKMVLDIGSGTGLLMLMLAQKSKARIDGIEIDISAFQQLRENIEGSPWHDRLNVFHGDIRSHHFNNSYDLIITNPPFFESELQSPSREKNLARHSTELTLEELVETIDKNLTPGGSFGVLIPAQRAAYFQSITEKQKFFLQEKLAIQQTPTHEIFRAVMLFSRQEMNEPLVTTMSIKNSFNEYSDFFIELMKEYYLNL